MHDVQGRRVRNMVVCGRGMTIEDFGEGESRGREMGKDVSAVYEMAIPACTWWHWWAWNLLRGRLTSSSTTTTTTSSFFGR